MTEQERIEILMNAKNFFRDKIVNSHINGAVNRASTFSEYNINPFLYKYLANFLKGDDSARSIAEALIYPRLLGSSITTTFGMHIQSLISTLFQGFGSTTPGIDIEFTDALDGRKKYCQLKSGPNTINHHDVETIINHFRGTINLARVNNLPIAPHDMIVGIIYGEESELSGHYQRVDKSYPVLIGENFWYHLTGKKSFYVDLISAFGEVALDVDGRQKLEMAVDKLAAEISATLGTD